MVEYGLIVSAIAVLLIATLDTLGTALSVKFQGLADLFNSYWN